MSEGSIDTFYLVAEWINKVHQSNRDKKSILKQLCMNQLTDFKRRIIRCDILAVINLDRIANGRDLDMIQQSAQ